MPFSMDIYDSVHALMGLVVVAMIIYFVDRFFFDDED